MTTGLHSRPLRWSSRKFAFLFACFALTIPLNNSFEVAAMMRGTLVAQADTAVSAWSVALTPAYVKGLKDVFVLLSIGLCVYTCVVYRRRTRILATGPFLLLNVFVVVILLQAMYSLTFMPVTIVLAGLRGYWAVVFVYAGALFSDIPEQRLYKWVAGVFWMHLALQAVQFVTDVGYAVYFEHRSPGLFLIPATAGGFALIVHYFGIRFNNLPLKLASVASLLLCNSTTGFLCILAYYAYTFRNKFKPKILYYPFFFIAVAAIGYVVFLNLGTLTGRGGGATFSMMMRLTIIYSALSDWHSLIFGQGMGIATSQALLLGYPDARIADNTYIGLLYNAGALPALLMLGFVVSSYRFLRNRLLYLLFVCYSMTTVIFEINPVIQILLILLGMQIGRSESERIGIRSVARQPFSPSLPLPARS